MESVFSFVQAQVSNQFLSGGIVLVVFTAILAWMRNVPVHLWMLFRRQFITTVDISDHDQAFFWLQKWLGEHEYTKKSRLLTASTRTLPVSWSKAPDAPAQKSKTAVIFSPAPGTHLLRYNGHWLLLQRNRKESSMATGDVAYHEAFTFYTFSRTLIQDLIIAAREVCMDKEPDGITIYRAAGWHWKAFQRRKPRALESVVLPDNLPNRLADDVQNFFSSADWYQQQGIPYQRGYLLYGPPGNGKTSLIVAIASKFGRDIYSVNLAAQTDESFTSIMGDVPEHGIVLFEDIDAAFADERDRPKGSYLTFSSFINCLDGVSAPHGRILFMTTNHVDKLDPALIRPGRIDKQFNIGNATPEQARQIFLRFFPGFVKEAEMFATNLAMLSREPSMAELQEHLLVHRHSALEAQHYRSPRSVHEIYRDN